MNTTVDNSRLALVQSDALSLLAYILASAEGCLKEPPIYGVHRLATAAMMLAESWEPNAPSETADFLKSLIGRWESEAGLLCFDPDNLKSYLSLSGVAIAEEIKRQSDQEEDVVDEP